MLRRCQTLLFTTLLALLPLQAAQAAEGGQPRRQPTLEAGAEAARVIVKYRDSASVLSSDTKSILAAGSSSGGPQAAGAMGKRLGLTLTDGRAISARTQVLHATGMSSRRLAEQLAQDSEVEWAVEDKRRFISMVPNDPLYAAGQASTTPAAGQWYLRPYDSTIVSAINAQAAWDTTQGSSSIVVAVLDTGVIKAHPDLASKLLSGYDFINTTAVANDGDGRDSDASDPGDWITSTENASGTFKDCGVSNSSWHGTRTASLIGAATNNSVGMAGVAPNVMLLPLRVLGKCGGYDSDIQAAMRWAAGLSVSGLSTNTNPARVINMSLGSTDSCNAAYQSVVNELVAAKVAIVAAAGNEGLAVGTPANCSGVIAVAGIRHAGTKVGYSSLGPEVAISAPAGNCVNETGTCVYGLITATNSGTTSPTNTSTATYNNGTNYSVGTSFAAPLVSGTVALMLSANSNLTPGELTSLLKSSARSFPTNSSVSACQAPSSTAQTSECNCTTTTCGAGMLDTAAAVQAAAATVTPTPVISSSATLMLAGESVTLSGSGSTASSGRSLASYAWAITSGTGLASLSATSGASVTLSGSAEGQVTVRLTVTDSLGVSASQTVTVTVAAGRPSASFTASTSTPTVGASVTLNGSASSAQGSASISAYQWEITSGTSLASFSSATNASTATLLASAAGTVTVRLTVTDNNGYTGSSSQNLVISAASSSTTTSGSTSSSTSSSSGGGGSLGGWGGALWLLGLALASLALGRRPRA
jgi:serine protease